MTARDGIRNQELGRFGEEKAAEHLISEGCVILERNFRCRLGEIDLIAEKDGILIFAEVKLRKSDVWGNPFEYVTADKQRKLILAAQYYLMKTGRIGCDARFDVIGIRAPNGSGGKIEIEHLEDAFSVSGR